MLYIFVIKILKKQQMKQFFKMMFAATFGVFFAFLLMGIISTFIFIVVIASIGLESKAAYLPKMEESVFKLSFNGLIVEDAVESSPTLFFSENTSLSMKDILASIRNAKKQNAIKGIYLDMGLLLTGTSNVDAIRRELIDFKQSGKFIVAYADNYTQAGYYLASVADEVYLNPQGALALTGMSSETMFYKGLLEKIGVEMMVFKVGKYKGAVEPFLGDKLSNENREQITSYQQGIWSNVINGIAKSRGILPSDINHFANEGLFLADPMNAVECGLIDDVKYRVEVEKIVKGKAEQLGGSLKTIGVSKMKRAKESEREYHNKIAVLYAEGDISSVPASYSISTGITEKLAKELKKLQEDERVKAVVLRVNSPGGNAYVSEQIWKQVIELKKTKPIVVSMGNVAASGGYYISCAADKIVAEENTLTGSIGIFGLFPNTSGLFNKLALTTDVVKTNTYADLGDPSRPMTADEQALVQASIERGYDVFLTRCAEGRGMSKEDIDAIGQGRVWTGRQAYELGLVDELGGINDAIELAVELSDVVNYTIVHVSTATDFMKELFEKQFEDIKISMLRDMMGEEYDFFITLQNIKKFSGIQARLPYDLKPL